MGDKIITMRKKLYKLSRDGQIEKMIADDNPIKGLEEINIDKNAKFDSTFIDQIDNIPNNSLLLEDIASLANQYLSHKGLFPDYKIDKNSLRIIKSRI